MTPPATSSKPFKVGTTGWTVTDLLDSDISHTWEQGRYEIVEGALIEMPAAYFYGSARLQRLISVLQPYIAGRGEFATEVDIALTADRVVRADAVYMTMQDMLLQQKELDHRGDFDDEVAPVFVPPTLIIEALSKGHERHDWVTKRRWYAEARVPNYWLFNPYGKSLECLILDGPDYRIDQSGRDSDQLRPALFPGLVLRLAELWG